MRRQRIPPRNQPDVFQIELAPTIPDRGKVRDRHADGSGKVFALIAVGMHDFFKHWLIIHRDAPPFIFQKEQIAMSPVGCARQKERPLIRHSGQTSCLASHHQNLSPQSGKQSGRVAPGHRHPAGWIQNRHGFKAFTLKTRQTCWLTLRHGIVLRSPHASHGNPCFLPPGLGTGHRWLRAGAATPRSRNDYLKISRARPHTTTANSAIRKISSAMDNPIRFIDTTS